MDLKKGRMPVRFLKGVCLALLLLVATPLGVQGAMWFSQHHAASWYSADWSSTGSLPPAARHRPAVVRIYAARTGRWKGLFATHSWIVLKEEGAPSYQRWDKVGWGTPVRRNIHAPDGRWYGNEPVVVFAADGPAARRLIPKLRAAIDAYAWSHRGDYHAWPGPNSNTFVAAVMAAVPEIEAVLPPTAIGKDFPLDGSWAGLTPSHTGIRLSLGGYIGLTVGWLEGLEINILGAVVGLDIRRPGLKLPGIGRIGV